MQISCALPSQTYSIFMASRLIEIVRIVLLIKLFICPEIFFLSLIIEIKPRPFQSLALE